MPSVPWRRIGAVAAAGLMALAALLAVLDVRVRGDDRVVRSCGSSLDVMAGRADWQTWRAEDLLELPRPVSGAGSLTRAETCPRAVNGRTAWAGGLAVAAVILAALSWPGPRLSAATHRRDPTRRLALAIVSIGCVVTVAGLIGIGLLVANPRATLFLYVSRPVALLVGLSLLAPAVAMILAGWALFLAVRVATPDVTGGDDR